MHNGDDMTRIISDGMTSSTLKLTLDVKHQHNILKQTVTVLLNQKDFYKTTEVLPSPLGHCEWREATEEIQFSNQFLTV